MRIYRSLEEARSVFAPSALTIGNFDGVHAAHRQLMRTVVHLARKCGARPSALTFYPHPAEFLAPERAPLLLSSPAERCALMERDGIEQVLILPFDERVSSLDPKAFFREILVDGLGARAVAVGQNFLFGRKQRGNASTLRELGRRFDVTIEIVPAVRRRGVIVSSSEIRRLLAVGDVAKAGRLLDRPFALTGHVVAGAGRGRRETVPTLNLEIAALAFERAALPANGVYITRTSFGPDTQPNRQSWRSVTNVGVRPTFGGHHLTIETFLLDPLIGAPPQRIRVEFLRRIREERAFPSADELRAQILRDVGRAEVFFRRTAGLISIGQ
ncbi:MAG: riboflavin biosynthesis protein RibF [Bryobacteraceae bacterium]|jgi:riboflavin kinase/FMN adenylyltransferase